MAFIQLVSRKGIKHDKNRSEKEGKKETVLEKELILYSTYTHTHKPVILSRPFIHIRWEADGFIKARPTLTNLPTQGVGR